MTQNLTIRRAGLADVKAIWAIEKQSFPTPWSRWSFLAELGHPFSHTLVAGPPPPEPWETWGYLVFWVVADEMHILNLAVHPRRRAPRPRPGSAHRGPEPGPGAGGRGGLAGSAPLQHPALNLYESFGFKEVGRRPRYYDDTQEDAILLTRVLGGGEGK